MSDKTNSRFIPQEPVTGSKLSLLNKRKVIQGRNAQGELFEIEAGGTIIRPDGNDGYEEVEIITLDSHGFPIGGDVENTCISHTGRSTPVEKAELCTSRFHPNELSRIICVGVDGKLTGSGAICLRCLAWLTLIKQLLAIIGVGIFIGILIGIL